MGAKEVLPLTYPNTVPARFLSRPNRFVAQVDLAGQETTVHVKNTGRCRELLVPGAQVWLTKSGSPKRNKKRDDFNEMKNPFYKLFSFLSASL